MPWKYHCIIWHVFLHTLQYHVSQKHVHNCCTQQSGCWWTIVTKASSSPMLMLDREKLLKINNLFSTYYLPLRATRALLKQNSGEKQALLTVIYAIKFLAWSLAWFDLEFIEPRDGLSWNGSLQPPGPTPAVHGDTHSSISAQSPPSLTLGVCRDGAPLPLWAACAVLHCLYCNKLLLNPI